MKRKLLILIIVLLALLLALCAVFLFAGAPAEETAAEPEPSAPTQPALTAAPASPEPSADTAPLPEGEPQYPARTLELRTDAGEQAEQALLDNNYYTDWSFPAGTVLTLSADEEIHALYILFGTYPGEWTLRFGDSVQRCGRDGFLHEYVAVSSPAKSLELAFGEDDGVMIRNIFAFSEGYLPDFVQTWRNLEEGADILLFPTHYDDELLFMGGLIPYYAAVRGLNVQVAYMTSNYLTDFSNYRFRPHEALNGLWVAGERFYPMTNEVDDYECRSLWAAEEHYGPDQFVAFQVEMIRRFKPLVVVSHDVNGEYGHGGHMLAAVSLERAVVAAADPDQHPESAAQYGVWDTPKTYLHIYGDWDEQTRVSYEHRAPQLGWRTPYEVAAEAYRQHLTQQQWEGFYVFGTGHSYDSHRFGLYRSLVGPDEAKNDLMEHVSRELFPYE